MSPVESLLPRPALFNAALYSVSALIYTVTLFVLETVQPGKYLFDPITTWRDRFSALAICSWPILFFGSLILIAVRVCGETRKRKSKKAVKKKKKKKKSTTTTTINQNEPAPVSGAEESQRQLRRQNSKKQGSKKRRVPRGYVLVTRVQRMFATCGFLWVGIGLACTSVCGLLVFLGQRERYRYNRDVLGVDEQEWKTWLIPAITGLVPLLVYGVMTVTTLAKFWMALIMRENVNAAGTPATSEENDIEYGVEVVFEQSEDEGTIGMMREDALEDLGGGVLRPDDGTVDRLLRQLRDMGFKNPQQNLAALEASSFDLELASDKLMNAQV